MKCRHIAKTSELTDSRYGEKYKMARSIFCGGITPIIVASFCCLSTGCLLIRHCNRPGSVVQVSAVAYRGGVWGVQPPTPPKFRSFYKAEPNSQFRGKYIRNNLTRIRLSLIFWVVSWKDLPASYDPHSGIFFLQGMTWRKNKVPKIKKSLPYEMKFLVPNYSYIQNPCLGDYRPQIPVLSVLCPQPNLLNPPPEKKSRVRHWVSD
jgi:hypothetical protein